MYFWDFIVVLRWLNIFRLFLFSTSLEKMLRKPIILSAGIQNFVTKLSFKAMNQRYTFMRTVKCSISFVKYLQFDQAVLLWK